MSQTFKLITLILSSVILFGYCQSEKSTKSRESRRLFAPGQKLILGHEKGKPHWTQYDGGIGEIRGEKYIYFVGEGDSKFRKSAVSMAKDNAREKAVYSFNILVAHQFFDAWKRLGLKNTREMEIIKDQIILMKRSIRLKGMTLIDSFSEQIGVIKKIQKDRPIISHREVRVYVLYGISYRRYINLRTRMISRIKRKLFEPERIQFIEDMENALLGIDKIKSYHVILSKRKR